MARRLHFTIALPIGRKWVEEIIEEHIDSVASPANYREVGENGTPLYMATKLYKWGKEGRRTYVHLYYTARTGADMADGLRSMADGSESNLYFGRRIPSIWKCRKGRGLVSGRRHLPRNRRRRLSRLARDRYGADRTRDRYGENSRSIRACTVK